MQLEQSRHSAEEICKRSPPVETGRLSHGKQKEDILRVWFVAAQCYQGGGKFSGQVNANIEEKLDSQIHSGRKLWS